MSDSISAGLRTGALAGLLALALATVNPPDTTEWGNHTRAGVPQAIEG